MLKLSCMRCEGRILRRHKALFFPNLQISRKITPEHWLYSSALSPNPFKSSALLKWQDLHAPFKGLFWSARGCVCSSTWINLIFQLHILLHPPPLLPTVVWDLLGNTKNKEHYFSQTPLEGFPPSNLCKAHFGFSSSFKGSSHKKCISAGSCRWGCAMELNSSIIMLSNAFFRPGLPKIFWNYAFLSYWQCFGSLEAC